MSAPNREAIAVALMQRLQQKLQAPPYSVVTFLRAYVDPNQLQPEAQPALLLIADNYVTTKARGRPNVWLMNMLVILYARPPESPQNAAPPVSSETQLNLLIDGVEEALDRAPSEAITDNSNPTDTNLGGLVSRASLSGAIDLIPGEAGGQGAAMIPIEILVTSGT